APTWDRSCSGQHTGTPRQADQRGQPRRNRARWPPWAGTTVRERSYIPSEKLVARTSNSSSRRQEHNRGHQCVLHVISALISHALHCADELFRIWWFSIAP